ncbi:MAG: ATP-binding protein [Candidatus Omnitrophota bacterium]
MKYIPRWMETNLAESLGSNPVVVLTGPRQVGKSTLLEQADFFKDWRYVTLDDADALEQAKEDPKGLLAEDRPTIIDEVQRCPELLLTVKYLVDKTHRQRKFVLSGSGNVSLRKAPRETLAGRARYLHLTGFGFREFQSLPAQGVFEKVWEEKEIKAADVGSDADIMRAVWRGCLPGVVLAGNQKIALERMSSYVDTFIQRDIHDLLKIRHPQHFRRLMELLAKATGWENVQEELASSCGETRTNVSRYMSLLKDTNVLYELKGYSTKGERAYKQAKYFWFDSGVASFLSGIHSPQEIKKDNVKGKYFENFVFQQILSWASLQMIAPELRYWKPKNGEAEVDFVIRCGDRVVGVEVKSSKQLSFGDTRSMREFLKVHPEAGPGIIVYAGDKVYPIATNIYAVPVTAF